jgi:hypothetical protein
LIKSYFRGFSEDAYDEGEINATATKELWKRDENAYYYKDPKKALRNWLEVFTKTILYV